MTNITQQKHCKYCNELTELQDLGYKPPHRNHPYGEYICIGCINELRWWEFKRVKLPLGWIPQYTRSEWSEDSPQQLSREELKEILSAPSSRSVCSL